LRSKRISGWMITGKRRIFVHFSPKPDKMCSKVSLQHPVVFACE
jgi:hypothetical protein